MKLKFRKRGEFEYCRGCDYQFICLIGDHDMFDMQDKLKRKCGLIPLEAKRLIGKLSNEENGKTCVFTETETDV